MNRIENVAIHRRKQESGWNRRHVQLQTGAKFAACRRHISTAEGIQYDGKITTEL
jgi:hypothetical protein